VEGTVSSGKIKTLYAFIVTDPAGVEGVLRRDTPWGTQPMIGDSIDALEQFRHYATVAAADMGLPLSIARFERVPMDARPRDRRVDHVAAAIANVRLNRNHCPAINNVLSILPAAVVEEVREDASAAIDAIEDER
jgi:hypothetical protein